ncbi:NAD-P-binding protein [Panus rudis PR-1116 ss-1]|nr:NAD-P-binding protein [Panus rudis PR-1116 ss-1]
MSSGVPSKIQAVVITETGDFDVIKKIEVPFAAPAKDQIVIKVNYAGINFIDNYFRQGLYPVKSFPAQFGTEAAGTIVSLPSDESVLNDEEYKLRGFAPGAKVVALTFGAYAEYISVSWKDVYVVPPSISLKVAGAIFTQGGTALTFITEAYNVKKGDIVFVHTVAGGFGLAVAQLAKARGATVIGTTSTKEKAEIAKAHGADHVILYKEEDTVKRVNELTNGEGVHVVYDGVGKDTHEIDFKLVRRKGTIVFVGNASGPVPPIAPLKLVEKNIKLVRPTLKNYIYTPEEGRTYISQLFDAVSKQELKVLIHKEYPFTSEGVIEAEKDLTGGRSIGKLLVKVADE